MSPKAASPSQHQLGVLGHVLFHQIVQQRLQDVCEVLQLAVQGHSEQRCHVGPVSGGKGALGLQSVNELEQRRRCEAELLKKILNSILEMETDLDEEEFAVEQVGELD